MIWIVLSDRILSRWTIKYVNKSVVALLLRVTGHNRRI